MFEGMRDRDRITLLTSLLFLASAALDLQREVVSGLLDQARQNSEFLSLVEAKLLVAGAGTNPNT